MATATESFCQYKMQFRQLQIELQNEKFLFSCISEGLIPEGLRNRMSIARDVSDVTFVNKSQTISPLARQLKAHADSDVNISPEPVLSKKGPALKRCPCGNSSGGKAWLLKCTACDQMWHNSCANLKGNLPKSTVDQLDHWQCPWCFACPFEPPK